MAAISLGVRMGSRSKKNQPGRDRLNFFLDCWNFSIDENQHLLMGTSNFGIVHSEDMGDSWQYTGPAISRVRCLSFSQSDYIISGIEYFNTTWGGTLNNGGVFYSTNEGNTWKPAGLHEKSVQAVCSDESNSILAGTSDGVYYLPDFDSSRIPSGLPNTSILCLERAPNGDVFAGTIGSALYLSPDNGASWSYAGLLNKSIRSIMTDNSQTIYAGTENEGIYRSLDGGISWQFLGLANTSIASIVQAGSQIFAATNSGVYKSTDNGTSWSFTGLNGNSVQDRLFHTLDTEHYTSKKPYNFGAGGKGLDLLRIKTYSQRFGFDISVASQRCIYIPTDSDLCPGKISSCPHCRIVESCYRSGGSTFCLTFQAAK